MRPGGAQLQPSTIPLLCMLHSAPFRRGFTLYLTLRPWERAQDAVDKAIEVGGLTATSACITEALPVLGSVGWVPDLFTSIAQSYTVPHRPGMIDTRVAKHLAAAYGDRAPMITKVRHVQRRKQLRIVGISGAR